VVKDVEVIISHRANLTTRYGVEGCEQIAKAVVRLKESMTSAGIESHIRWLESPLPQQVRESIGRLEREFGSQEISLLIIGGDEIVPFFRLRNEVEDGDADIPSDGPYASQRDDWIVPDRAVGRIPGTEAPAFLLGVLDNAARRHSESARTLSHSRRRPHGFGYSTSKWKAASKAVYRAVFPKGRLRLSPPVTEKEFRSDWLREKAVCYFNLHGLKEKSGWYGERAPTDPTDYPDFPVALLPDLIPEVSGAAVFSEACYGGYVLHKTVDTSVALKFLDQNADCFVGSSAIAYGPYKPPSTEADLLCKYFFQYVSKGVRYGNAFANAKRDFVRKMLRTQGYLDEDDRKTLAEFNLFGDPGLRWRTAS